MSKTIYVGAWNRDQQEIEVDDSTTVKQALDQVEIVLAPTQSVTTHSDATNVEMNDEVRDGETYLITGNQTSG